MVRAYNLSTVGYIAECRTPDDCQQYIALKIVIRAKT